MLNWKTILGSIIVLGALAEFSQVLGDYLSGKMTFWPFGVEIGTILLVWLGVFLARKGLNTKR